MARPAAKYPTELELQMLKVLWQQSPLLAREIQAALAAQDRDLARTSVITTLNTMIAKKYLTRTKNGNTYLFSPLISQGEVAACVLDDVVDRVFDGSTANVLLKLFDVTDIDEEELRELRRIINHRLKNS